MLLVAIPKSGSTSLMVTLGEVHGLAAQQLFFSHRPPPSETRVLHRYHSDVRELEEEEVRTFEAQDRVFKQHIPPTPDNLRLLRPLRKVILLRAPEEIIQAYYRAERRGLHRPRKEFHGCTTGQEWMERGAEIGLLDDLSWFFRQWQGEGRAFPDQCLMIQFQDLIQDTTDTMNSVERFFGLPPSPTVSLSRERYTRESTLKRRLRQIPKLIRRVLG